MPSMTMHPSPIEHDPRWQAVLAREPSRSFVYAVTTTGIYCRPDCPSRRAKPAHVAFFDTGVAAGAAGFRPCLRCRPDDIPRRDAEAALVTAACRTLEGAEGAPSLAALAETAGLSRFHFHRLFKATTGLTPRAYGAAHRAERLRTALADDAGSVTHAAYAAGFNASSRFYAQAKTALGMAPRTYRRGGDATTIHFAVGQCSLGSILVASTPKGVCAILLGDDAEVLVRDLQNRFPNATLLGADPDYEATVAAVVGFVDAPRLGLDLPLDLQGTAFQERVWQALRAIPAGETASYTEIAGRIGAPKAVRAVAQACAANPIAVAVPCHRILRHDGAVSGYRWGVDRKRALLLKEGTEGGTRI